MYRQHLKIYLLNLALGNTDYNLWAVAAAAAGGAERHNTRQVTTLYMQVIWINRLCLCVCVRLMTVVIRKEPARPASPIQRQRAITTLLTRYAICMSFGLIYRPRRMLRRRELLERCLKLTVSLLKSRLESEMRTASNREHRFVSKMSTPNRREHGGTSAAGMPGSGGAPKTLVFHR